MRVLPFSFQSLFYWKLLWKLDLTKPTTQRLTVSILVLLEIALEEVEKWLDDEVRGMFQSLFYWKLLWKVLWQIWRWQNGSFQSLFYWKLLWKSPWTLGYNYGVIVVSILVLLEIALEDASAWALIQMYFGFNPCSIGNCSGRMHFQLKSID